MNTKLNPMDYILCDKVSIIYQNYCFGSGGVKYANVLNSSDKRRVAKFKDKNAIIKETDNNNFELKIIGARYEIIECEVYKKGIQRFILDVSSSHIIDIIKQSTLQNGKFIDKDTGKPCKFKFITVARNQNILKIVHDGMSGVADIISEKVFKKDNCTNKYKIGYIYESSKERLLYIGDYYNLVTSNNRYSIDVSSITWSNAKKSFMVDMRYINYDFKKASDFIEKLEQELKTWYMSYNCDTLFRIISTKYYCKSIKNKASRIEREQVFECDIDFEAELGKIMDKLRDKMFKQSMHWLSIPSEIDIDFNLWTTRNTELDINNMTEQDIVLLRLLYRIALTYGAKGNDKIDEVFKSVIDSTGLFI